MRVLFKHAARALQCVRSHRVLMTKQSHRYDVDLLYSLFQIYQKRFKV